MTKSVTSYPIEVLLKSRAAMEANMKGAPGMLVTAEMISSYQRQVKEVNKAIEYLELREKSIQAKRTKQSQNQKAPDKQSIKI